MARTDHDGGAAVVQWLKSAGITEIYSVSGGPINAVYRACDREGVQLVHCRHEAAACFMAEARARVLGRAGAAVVTLGPGVSNTVTPALVSNLGGTPLLIIGAQSATTSADRGAGMSFDVLPAMRSVTKWAARCSDPDRLAEYLDMAWRNMWAGRPGPVFLEVPTDVLSASARPRPVDLAPPSHARAGLRPDDAEAMGAAMARSRRPLLLIGDEAFYDPSDRLEAAIERHGIPFMTLRLARGLVPETHPLCAGPGYAPCNGALRRALAEADCILMLGHHFEFDLEFGESLGDGARVIQIASDPALLHRNRRADLAVAASPSAWVDWLAAAPVATPEAGWAEGLVADWHAEHASQAGEDDNTGLHPVTAIDAVCASVPPETIFVTSHGNIDFWADARLQLRAPGRYLRAGQSGALGAELPYGVGAAFADPDAPVVVFVGDGGVGFHLAEIDTAARYGRRCTIVVLDDQLWGAIALPQAAAFGETYEMELPRRDWAKVAEGLGARGYVATTADEIGQALKEAVAAQGPSLVQVPVRSVISPYMAYIS